MGENQFELQTKIWDRDYPLPPLRATSKSDSQISDITATVLCIDLDASLGVGIHYLPRTFSSRTLNMNP